MSDIWHSFIELRKGLTGSDQFSKGIYGSHYQRLLFERKSKETTMRFLVKAMIAKILYDEGHSFVCNWRYTVNRKVFDTIPLIDIENGTIYRFGTGKIEIKHQNYHELNIDIGSLKTNFECFKNLEEEIRGMLKNAKKI